MGLFRNKALASARKATASVRKDQAAEVIRNLENEASYNRDHGATKWAQADEAEAQALRKRHGL